MVTDKRASELLDPETVRKAQSKNQTLLAFKHLLVRRPMGPPAKALQAFDPGP